MMGDPAFFPLALRLLASGLVLALSAYFAVLALRRTRAFAGRSRPSPKSAPRPDGDGPLTKARAHRPGQAELAALIGRTARRPFARDLLAGRLRALAREAVALRLGLDEAEARAAIEDGSWASDPRIAAFLDEDFLAAPGREHAQDHRRSEAETAGTRVPAARWASFGEGLEGSLAFLEEYALTGRAEPATAEEASGKAYGPGPSIAQDSDDKGEPQ